MISHNSLNKFDLKISSIYNNNNKMPHKIEPSFLELNPYYNLKYNELLKEARVWNNSAQYWLGQEALRRANCLLRGDIDGYTMVKHSHELYYPYLIYK